MNKYLINLNNPCHEDWEGMSPTERGRFCSLCSKEVIDFSNSTDNDIIKFIEASKGKLFCGQFEATQLNRWMEQTELKRANPAAYKWLLSLLLLTSTQAVIAQGSNHQVQVETKDKSQGNYHTGTVKGFVFDTLGKPIPNANIQLAKSDTSRLTDEKGGFSILATVGDTLMAYKDGVLVNRIAITDIAQTYIITNPSTTQATKQERVIDTRLFLRGMPSIQTNHDPLWVIDGLLTNANPLEFIDTKKIKSINILKEATAMALYGYLGNNGVIMVQTKLNKRERKHLLKQIEKSPAK